MEPVKIVFGHENFGNYRRLAYRWWYALAEFVDNSSQSYLDNRASLDEVLAEQHELFRVTIATDKDFVRISDNAMGMDLAGLRRAMVVGQPPENASGRCRYGLGMKTAACWIGNDWRIITTKLGDSNEYTVEISVDEILEEVSAESGRTLAAEALKRWPSLDGFDGRPTVREVATAVLKDARGLRRANGDLSRSSAGASRPPTTRTESRGGASKRRGNSTRR